MGFVYKVRQKELDRIAALKILPPGTGCDPAFAERFAREAKALAKLNHSGIVTIYDSGHADGLFYFLMEFVDGVSLGELMRGGRVSPREALAIVPRICDALQYAHDHGIVHRDIKPENILLDRQGRVKVADFGLAKLLGNATEPAQAGDAGPALSSSLTGAGKVMGTPHYMAPEQAEDPAAVDHRADIYALGVVFYQMLTGELPGPQLDPPSKKFQIDVRLDEVVLHALEKEPGRRYQQVSEVKTAVESIVQTAGPDSLKSKASPERVATPSSPPLPAPSLAAATPPPDRARCWFFATATVCLIGFCLLVLLAIGGLFISIALPAFVRAREHARSLAQEQAQRANALAAEGETGLAGRETTVVKSFGVQDPTLSQNLVVTNNAWFIDSATNQVVRLFEVPNPGVEQGRLIYSAQLKTEGLKGRAYLEMGCRFPGITRVLLARGSGDAVSGSVDWSTHETPVFVRPGDKPDLIKLNVVVEGPGRVWIRDAQLLKGP